MPEIFLGAGDTSSQYYFKGIMGSQVLFLLIPTPTILRNGHLTQAIFKNLCHPACVNYNNLFREAKNKLAFNAW